MYYGRDKDTLFQSARSEMCAIISPGNQGKEVEMLQTYFLSKWYSESSFRFWGGRNLVKDIPIPWILNPEN